jgi:hypothetical protein
MPVGAPTKKHVMRQSGDWSRARRYACWCLIRGSSWVGPNWHHPMHCAPS